MLFVKNETAKNIIRKLYRWFVYYEIDSQTEQNVISPLANIFIQNNFEIKQQRKANDLLQKENYQLLVQSVSLDDLQHANEIFFCNAVRGIRWVDQFNSKKLTNKLTAELFQLFVTQIQ